MTPKFKKFGLPLFILIVGSGFLVGIWWVNGAELDDLWLYLFSEYLIIYAAYEVFSGFSKRLKDK